eukprot:jgi/Hompol1/3676/HPOL_003325-RA
MENILKLVEDCAMKTATPIVFNGTLSIFECLLMEYGKSLKSRAKSARSMSNLTFLDTIEDAFHYAIIWSFGAAVSCDRRAYFQQVFQRLVKVSRSTSRLAAIITERQDISIFDLKFDPSTATWSSMIDSAVPNEPMASRILTRQREIITLLLRSEKNVLLLGEIGTRKTSLATEIMLELCTQEKSDIMGHATPLLPASDVSELFAHFHKVLVADDQAAGGGHDFYVPVNGNLLIIFVDDLHIPTPNPEGSRTMWEFLRFFVDHKAYCFSPQVIRHVRKIATLAVCDLLRNSVVVLPPRLMRHFSPMIINESDVYEDAARMHYTEELQATMEYFQVESIASRIYSAVNASLDILRLLKRQLGLSSHGPFYLFSSHDLEKLFEGLLMGAPFYYSSNEGMFKLWLHETRRVFEDRITHGDLTILDDCLRNISRKYFHGYSDISNIIFSDIEPSEITDGDANEFLYQRVPSREVEESDIFDITQTLRIKAAQTEGNVEDISLFSDGAIHFARLDRVLAAEKHAHAILVCRPGMDISMDIVRLVVTARGLPLKEVVFRESVNLDRWRAFIRKQVTDAGLAERRIVVSITFMRGVKLTQEVWGDLHSIYDGARSRHLWPAKEYEDLMNKVAHQYRTLRENYDSVGDSQNVRKTMFSETGNRQPTQLETTQFWAHRVQCNVCIVLRVDATDVDTHQSLLKFPRLISRSTIDIYRDCLEEDLFQIARRSFAAVFDDTSSMFVTENETLCYLLVKIFEIARSTIRGPERRQSVLSVIDFSRFIMNFNRYVSELDRGLRTQLSEYHMCLRRTTRLKERVQRLVESGKEELGELPDRLSRISDELSGLSIAIKTNKEEAERLESQMREKQETAVRLVMEREAAIANAGLTEAKNAFEDAIQKLHLIKRNDIEELKTFVVPPPLLALVSDGLCILFDRPGGWGEARKLLSSHTFLQRVMEYDYTEMPELKLEKLRKVVDLPGFQIEKTAKVGTAVKALSTWLKTMIRYCRETRSRLQMDASHGGPQISRIQFESVDNESEKLELTQLQEYCEAMSEREAYLLHQKRELTGRMTLIKEIFSPDSMFDNAKPDHTNESQWIQQAFESQQGRVVFSTEEVENAHTEYQNELAKLELIREGAAKDLNDATISKNDIKVAIESMTLEHIVELMQIKDNTGSFTESARTTLLKLLKLPVGTTPEVIYQKMVFSTAISPFQACRGAFLVRDIIIAMFAYHSKKERVDSILTESKKQLGVKKAHFDRVWQALYSDQPEYWTFEVIIQKYKEIHDMLRESNPCLILEHLEWLQRNQLLRTLLTSACRLVSWDNGIQEFKEKLEQDPVSFNRAIVEVKIGNEATQRLVTEDNLLLDGITSKIDQQLQRIYVDILSIVPKSVSFKILIQLSERDLCKISSVSKKWNELAHQQQLWKWQSHCNGWGIAFIYPKSLDWREFHHRLCILRRRRINEVLSVFDDEISGTSGLKATKRLGTFLKKVPEYSHMERADQDSTRRTIDLVQLELTNEIFLAVEERFNHLISLQDPESSSPALIPTPAHNGIDSVQTPRLPSRMASKNTSMRYKRAYITARAPAFGMHFKRSQVHELVIEKAAKMKCLHISMERIKKHVTRVDIEVAIDCSIPPFPTDSFNSHGPPRIPFRVIPEAFGMFHTIADCLHIIYAYHRGIQMGKHIQFQVRFIRALKLLCDKIEQYIVELKGRQASLVGDTLLITSTMAFSQSLNAEERIEARRQWTRAIREHHLIRDQQQVFASMMPRFKRYRCLLETDQMTTNAMLLLGLKSDIILIDTNGLAQILLEELAEPFSNVTVIDALASDIHALLQAAIKTTGVIIIKNVGMDPSIHAEIIKFRSARYQAARELGDLVNKPEAKIIIVSSFDILHDLEPRLERLDFRFTTETLEAMLLDITLDIAQPYFHTERNRLRRNFETQSKGMDKWFDTIVELTKDRQSIEEELVHDIIMFQRRHAEVQELKAQREEYESEVGLMYVSYNNLVAYVMEVWKAIENLSFLKQAYVTSAQVVLDCFKKSIGNHLATKSASGVLERREMDNVVDDFTVRIGNQMGRSIAQRDRFALFAVLSMIKLRYYGTMTKKDDSMIATLVRNRAELTDPEVFTKWLQTEYLPSLEERPVFANMLDSLSNQQRRSDALWTGNFAEIFERRLPPLQRFMVQLIAFPQFIDTGMSELLSDAGIWTNDARKPSKYLENAEESSLSIILVVSISPRDACDKWIQKIEFAAKNGAWVLLVVDAFWISRVIKIYQLSKIQSAGFKIWIVSPSSFAESLPQWLYSESHTIYDEETADPWFIAQKMQGYDTILDDLHRPWLIILLKFHFTLVEMMQRPETSFQNFVKYDDFDLHLAIRCFAGIVKRKLSVETLKELLLETVYSLETRSVQNKTRLAAIWDETTRMYDKVILKNGAPLEKMTRETFNNFFTHAKPIMFTPRAMRVHMYGNAIDVDSISSQLCKSISVLLGVMQPTAQSLRSDMQVKNKIGKYLNTLPTTVNLRLIYENMTADSDNMVRCYLIEEANNFLRLLRRIRANLRLLLTSFSNGYATMSARAILDAIAQNQVLPAWIRRSHPTGAPLDIWIEDVSKRIKFLDKWISLGQPWIINASLPFSLRALLQTLRHSFAEKSGTSVDKVELMFDQINLHHFDKQAIVEISQRYSVATVVSGIYMDGTKISGGKIAELDAGKPDELPMFLVRPLFSNTPIEYQAQLIPTTTKLLADDAEYHRDRDQSTGQQAPQPPRSIPPSRRFSRLTTLTMSEQQPARTLYEYTCPVYISEEKGSITELLEDGSRLNQVCLLKTKTEVAPELLEQQGCGMLVDVAGKRLPDYLKSDFVDFNYLHSLSSMSDSLDRNISDASHHFTIYICSSSDAENERDYLFQHVFPSLIRDMAYRHIDL